MKILIVDSLFSPNGGGQKIAYDTYKLLKVNGHEVFYWGMDKKPYFEDNYKYVKYFTPYYIGKKDYLKNPIKYYYNYRAKNDLEKFVNLIKPDLIHYHSFWGVSTAIFNIDKNIPKVLTIHDARCCPIGTLMFKNKNLCKKQYCKKGNFLPCITNKCAKNSIEASIRRSFACFIDRNNFKYIDRFITPSSALKEKMLYAEYVINKEKIFAVNNFLNKDELKINPNYSNQGYFLYIGRLSYEKGVHYLLEAMKDLPKDIKLKIAGTGVEEDKLKQYVKENNLSNVEFLGFKNREEIKELYQNCISTILPSNCFEIFGMTNVESFINGKPVIASNIGGIPEIVEDNINGLLFEPGNVEQLKGCILKYWNNPNLVVGHGKNAYQKAITQYAEERYYKELIKIYKEIVNEKN